MVRFESTDTKVSSTYSITFFFFLHTDRCELTVEVHLFFLNTTVTPHSKRDIFLSPNPFRIKKTIVVRRNEQSLGAQAYNENGSEKCGNSNGFG